ncbi:hypothetical protein BD413DRAFT_480757, partial [Trametes elegans]
CHVPPEILDNIVLYLLAGCRSFSSVAAFALATHQFRQIALRRYYACLHVRSARHWVRMCRVLGVYIWVSSLEASTTCFQYKMDGLSRFTSLRALELDFSGDGLSTQGSRAALLFKNMIANLAQLKLTHLPRIDPGLLSLIASRFSSLSALELSCTERLDDQCCWLCLEESTTCTIHSPIPDAFPTVEALATRFGRAMKPLTRLEVLFLGVFLSDADALARHIERCAAIYIASPKTGFYAAPPFGPDKCAACSLEHAVATRERERVAKAFILEAVPSLRSVGFSSWFPDGQAQQPKELL